MLPSDPDGLAKVFSARCGCSRRTLFAHGEMPANCAFAGIASVRRGVYHGRTFVRTNRGRPLPFVVLLPAANPGTLHAGGTCVTGREILEEVVALLGQVPEGDEAEELCAKLKDWLTGVMQP
jgi:hypothetical protein